MSLIVNAPHSLLPLSTFTDDVLIAEILPGTVFVVGDVDNSVGFAGATHFSFSNFAMFGQNLR